MVDGGHIGQLKPDPRNARRHTARNVALIEQALGEVGAARSIVIDEDDTILAGNATIEAAAAAGIERLQIVEADGETIVAVRRRGLTPEQKRRLALFDNRTAELAEWDASVIASLVEDTDLAGLFTDDELSALLATLDAPTTGLTDPDAVPDPPAEPITQPGDLWRLGRHRLLCGDARSVSAVERLTNNAKVPLMVSDPPYCSGGFQESARAAGTWGDIASDSLSTRGYQSLITKALQAARPQTLYMFTDWRMWIPLYDLVESVGLAVRSMIVWDKGTPGLGGLWRTQHELIMFASRQTNKRIVGIGGNANVLQCARTGNLLHQTEKPVEVLCTILNGDAASERKDCSVYDPFLGSGSTLIAAEQLGRTCYGMEVEPRYCDVIVTRWEQFTGQTAEREQP